MAEDRITPDEMRYLSIFQTFTGATAFRCIMDEENNKLIFLVDKSELGKAIGRGGRNVKLLSKVFNKTVEIVGYASRLEDMVRNLFPGVKITRITLTERGKEKILTIRVSEEDKGRAIGRDGRVVKRARLVLSKLFGITRVTIR